VVFCKLSKVLHQEDALGARCLGCDFCSPQAPSRGAGMLRTGVIRRRGVTFIAGITESSRRHALMLPGGWRQCTGKAPRCRAKQGRREDGADMWSLTSIVGRFFWRFENGRNSLVTMVPLCSFIIARFHRLPSQRDRRVSTCFLGERRVARADNQAFSYVVYPTPKK
jgi:hypothetical protein